MNKLRNLKIGDKVIVGKGGSSDRIAEVGFVSDTQIKVNGLRYNILDGRLVGAEEGEKDRIMPATDKWNTLMQVSYWMPIPELSKLELKL